MEGNERKLKLIEYFIKTTPVGEIKEVLADLQILFGADLINSSEISNCLLDYLSFHGTQVLYEDKVLFLTPFSKQTSSFYDPKHSCSFSINPYDLSISDYKKVDPEPSFSQLLQSKLDIYLFQHFSDLAQARVFQSKDSHFIFLSCSANNLKSM